MSRFFRFGGCTEENWWRGVGVFLFNRTFELEISKRRATGLRVGRWFETTYTGWRFTVHLFKVSITLKYYKED